MIFNLILSGVLIVCFLLIVAAYALGVRHGRAVSHNSIPTAPNPVKAVERAVDEAKAKQKQEEFMSELDSVMNISVEDMLKAVEQDRAKGRV